MNILNLYCGLGGNRKLWTGHQVTAVEIRKDAAKIYADHFPDDEVIIGDAHEFLLQNYSRFDFIWTSTPCQSHSVARYFAYRNNPAVLRKFPDMALYQEIIFLDYYFDGLWVAENVKPFYKPLIAPSADIGRHLFWSNFGITRIEAADADLNQWGSVKLAEFHGFDLSGYQLESRKDDLLRNCVAAETGLHILDCAMGSIRQRSNQLSIF